MNRCTAHAHHRFRELGGRGLRLQHRRRRDISRRVEILTAERDDGDVPVEGRRTEVRCTGQCDQVCGTGPFEQHQLRQNRAVAKLRPESPVVRVPLRGLIRGAPDAFGIAAPIPTFFAEDGIDCSQHDPVPESGHIAGFLGCKARARSRLIPLLRRRMFDDCDRKDRRAARRRWLLIDEAAALGHSARHGLTLARAASTDNAATRPC